MSTTTTNVPSKNALLKEIITQEMAPDGNLDTDRVLAIARSRVKQLNLHPSYEVKRSDIHSRACEVRKTRKAQPTTPFLPHPALNPPTAAFTSGEMESLFAAKKLLKAFAFDLTKATATLQAVHTLFEKETP